MSERQLVNSTCKPEFQIEYSRRRRFTVFAIVVMVSIIVGCGGPKPPHAKLARPSNFSPDPWVIQAMGSDFKTPALAWNGRVGARLALDANTNPPSFDISKYEATGEEKISPQPSVSKSSLDPDESFSLDMRHGMIQGSHGDDYLRDCCSLADANSTDQFWHDFWSTDIEIEGPVEDQQAVRSFLFYLRTAIDPKAGMSISPYGLSSTTYNGHIFWDADTWVFPALMLVDPLRAKSIIDYRRARADQAKKNADPFVSKLDASKPNAGLKFPWESGITGKEVAPGESKKEEHVSGDVAWAQHQAEALGIVTDSGPIVRSVGTYYLARSVQSTPREMKDVMSPDEFHTGDNDLYTNLLAQWCANGGNWDGPIKFKLPKDEKSFLTYDHDPVKGYKQAAAVLSIYPLQFPEAEKQAKAMMGRFADKVTKNGPAMTESIHAIIWARIGEPEKAYETWHNSWKPFVFSPFLLFSEKRSKPSTYFTTGAAGSLQTVLYGFLGIRLDSKQAPGAQWSQKLPTGDWLSIKPNLPKAWKSVKFKGFTLLGKRYTLTASHDVVKVQPFVPEPDFHKVVDRALSKEK